MRFMIRAAVLVLVTLSASNSLLGCVGKNPVSCVDGYCNDATLPFCDVDGVLEGAPLTCIAVDCTPGAFAGCRTDQAIVCNNAGDNFDLSHCDHGCDPASGCIVKSCVPNTVSCGDRVVEECDANGVLHTTACDLSCTSSPAPHCAYISPQYLPDVCDALATEPTRDVIAAETIDTNQAAVCNGGIVAQTGGPDVCVMRYGTFTIGIGAMATVVGNRPLAIVSDGTLRISGTLDVSARGHLWGPGGGLRGNGGQASAGKGGGGAGFATTGAAGGSTSQAGGGLNAGALTQTITLSGGLLASINGLGDTSVGGGGGGGVALISCRHDVLIDGLVAAGGGGGIGGHVHIPVATAPYPVGGGGGGSGGMVVIQGLGIIVSGRMSANGGGGGCGKPSAGAAGADGTDGRDSFSPPMACIPGSNEGSGGSGGASILAPQVGGASTGGTPGGGGGSVGFLKTYMPSGAIPALTPTSVSPTFQPNENIPVR